MTKFFKNLFRLFLINTPLYIIFNYIKNFLPNYKSKGKSLKIENKIYRNFSSLDPNKKWFCNNLNFLTNSFNKIDNISEILEIGSYEGRSAVFFLETFTNSNLKCVDTWSGSDEHDKSDFTKIEKNFDLNIENFKADSRIEKYKMTSNDFFKSNNNKFDLVYVDGDHSSVQVYRDILNSWDVLNKGGYLVLDDYMWWYYKDLKKNPSTPINSFISDNINEISFLKIWQQVIIQKKLS